MLRVKNTPSCGERVYIASEGETLEVSAHPHGTAFIWHGVKGWPLTAGERADLVRALLTPALVREIVEAHS
jgi:hypothetical protein